MRKGQIGDEINGKLFEGEGGRGLNGGEWRGHRVCASLVLLANGAASNKVIDKYRKPRPPRIAFYNGLGTETSEMAREG